MSAVAGCGLHALPPCAALAGNAQTSHSGSSVEIQLSKRSFPGYSLCHTCSIVHDEKAQIRNSQHSALSCA